MNEVLTSLLTAALGLGTGAVLAILGSRKRLEVEYDIELRGHRIEAYQALWKILEPLAYYSPPEAVTFAVARDLSMALRSWYFEIGGLFLSERTRDAYFNLQKGLGGVIKEPVEHDHLAVGDKRFERLRGAASTLRTVSAHDVATRVKSRHPKPRSRRLLRRRGLDVSVRRGWLWAEGERECYSVLVENPLSMPTVEVDDVYFEAATSLSVLDGPMRLAPGGHWEIAVPAASIPAAPGDVGRRVRVKLTGGKVIKAKRGHDVEPHPEFLFDRDRPL